MWRSLAWPGLIPMPDNVGQMVSMARNCRLCLRTAFLSRGLGEALDNTLVITLTEFGRKLHQNAGYAA